ncbi:MAG: helix-turn-helix transcriptional regulator [Lachnospiraceae bacterium]|nr:helix-turn-helix transcriptional regulator [Lachnospiraceae bacterium]
MEFENCFLKDIGYGKFQKVVNMIGGKWKLRIIYVLAFHEMLRYSELKRLLSPITHKMLSTQLKELEKDGLVLRKEYPQVPPKVEYSLTQMGRDLKPVVKEIHNWIVKYDIQDMS